ncbi:MAG: CPXCG motif-containing cysteine-rich protein [Gammaproteobacteria bacterium]|nr:CPXCG motif-containing cysteine-rich protein [Gammaproteobacteria bacterium]
MRELQQQTVECPYCGENIDVLIEPSTEPQDYIEDCQVCCRPIDFAVSQDAIGSLTVTVAAENE